MPSRSPRSAFARRWKLRAPIACPPRKSFHGHRRLRRRLDRADAAGRLNARPHQARHGTGAQRRHEQVAPGHRARRAAPVPGARHPGHRRGRRVGCQTRLLRERGLEDRKFKRPFSRPLPPRQGSWPHLLWTWESASVLESVDSAAQTRPSWGSPPGEPWQALVDGQRHLRKDLVPDRRARRHQQRSPRQQARTDLGQPSRQHGRRTPCQTRCTSRRCAVPSARKTCKAWLGMPSGNVSPTATRSSPVLANTVLSVPTSLA